MAEDKAKLMREMRERRKREGMVRREVYIHNSRTREELDSAVKKLKTPKRQ